MRLVALALLACLAAPVSAQTPPPPPQPRPIQARPGRAVSAPASPAAQRLQSRYRFAVNALRNGNTAEAVRVLEDLVADAPEQRAFADKLFEAYEADGQTEAALELLDRRSADGPSVSVDVQRGGLLARAGRLDEARALWDGVLEADPGSEMTYRLVADALGALRYYDEAAAVLARGRETLGRDELFRLELAHLYGLAGDFPRSAELYAAAVAADGDAQAGVQGRIRALLAGAGAPQAFEQAFDRRIAEDPLALGLRETAAWLATEREDYDAALAGVRALDRLGDEDGERLLRFARTALAAGAPQAAGTALDDVLERHSDGPHAPAALLERARIAITLSEAEAERPGGDTPHADAARRTLSAFLDRFGGFAEASEAAFELGQLERDVTRDHVRADSLFVLASRSRDVALSGRALLARGEVAVRRGDLFDARDRYAEVDEGLRIGPLAEQARYELARLDFYEGFPLSALARVEALDNNTAADVSNDAIALGVTLRESLGVPDDSLHTHLDAFARASLLARRGLGSEALVLLDSLNETGPQHPLADQSLYLRAQTLRGLGDAEGALAALADLGARFPSSFFRDRALKLEADLYQHDLDDPDAARAALDRLLEAFPGSLLAPEARVRLRALVEAAPGS